jgi:hypothetical protein
MFTFKADELFLSFHGFLLFNLLDLRESLSKMAVFWVVAPCRLVWVYQNLPTATTQKTAIFIVTVVRNLCHIRFIKFFIIRRV